MPFINLFLSLFKFLLHLATNRKRLMYVLLMQSITVQALTRTLKRKGIRVSFMPHEKYIIASVFEDTPKAKKYFPFFSPRTILTAWKNAVSKHWSHPHKSPGRPPVSTDIKKLVLKLKKENPLWGARRIMDEFNKLSITISHETIRKILNHFRKTGDIQPIITGKRCKKIFYTFYFFTHIF